MGSFTITGNIQKANTVPPNDFVSECLMNKDQTEPVEHLKDVQKRKT
jgi:hypothetical protein